MRIFKDKNSCHALLRGGVGVVGVGGRSPNFGQDLNIFWASSHFLSWRAIIYYSFSSFHKSMLEKIVQQISREGGAIFRRTFCKIQWDCISPKSPPAQKLFSDTFQINAIFLSISWIEFVEVERWLKCKIWKQLLSLADQIDTILPIHWRTFYIFWSTLECKQMCSNIQYTSNKTKEIPQNG